MAKNNPSRKGSGSLALHIALGSVVCVVSLVLTVVLLMNTVLGGAGFAGVSGQDTKDEAIMDRYDMYMTNQVSGALEGILTIDKVYWLDDKDIIAPEPDQKCFGSTKDPSSLQWLLDKASVLLDLPPEEIVFSTDVQIFPGSEVVYYLDATIFCVTWRQAIGTSVYTMSEVKIAHASQFRRFLADGTYGSDKQYYGSTMAAQVNAVTASNADFYKFRPYGIVVYNGEVCRVDSRTDTCFVDDKGELIFVRRGQMTDYDTVQKFVEENGIRFSLCFGPIIVEDGQNVTPNDYICGEITKPYSRAGLGQVGPLHYMLVHAGFANGYQRMPTTRQFADQLIAFGCEKAYSLDGGQTGIIVTNDRLMNRPDYGEERTVSDIIYFATAIPEKEE